jgi:hypothetical protein
MKILNLGKLLALVLALLMVGFYTALPASGGGPASLAISGAAFRPPNSNVGFAWDEYSVYATSNPTEYWSAPVYLPQGAVVTSVRMFYKDNNTTYDCSGVFRACNLTGVLSYDWYVHSSGSSNISAYADTPTINHTIDYSQFYYILNWSPRVADSSMKLSGFQIFYTPPPGRTAVIPLF